MRLGIIGTSHVSMFHDAWGLLPQTLTERVAPTFIGMPAPMLAKQVHLGLGSDGDGLQVTYPPLLQYLKKTAGFPGSVIRFKDYDALVLVDLFFCYDDAILSCEVTELGPQVSGIPASWALCDRVLKGTMGIASYANHKRVGDVPKTDHLRLVERARNANPGARIFLTPRPMMPTQRLRSRFGEACSKDSVLLVADRYDQVAERALREMGIRYLARPDSSICVESGASKDSLSIGWIEPNRSLLNEHLNGDYAFPILERVLLDMA